MRDHTNEDAARAEERWFRGIDDAPTPPSDAGTSERETETHAHEYDSTGHCKVCGALRCPNCGRSEAEHYGTERNGCLVFSELEPMESQHWRNERAKTARAAAAVPQPTLCSVCSKPFTIDQHEQALRGTHDACALDAAPPDYWEDRIVAQQLCPCVTFPPCTPQCRCASPFQAGVCARCDGSGTVPAAAAPAADGLREAVLWFLHENPIPTRAKADRDDYSMLVSCGSLFRLHAALAAALPGAEAGTPTHEQYATAANTILHHLFGIKEGKRPPSQRDAAKAVNALMECCDDFATRLAALTSEVRALREDKARLDAIESGEVEIECMGTTVPYQWAHGPGGDHVAIRLDRNPKTLREAIDAARLASPSPTGAPAGQQKHEG